MKTDQEKTVSALLQSTNYGHIVSGYYSATVARWFYSKLHLTPWQSVPFFSDTYPESLLLGINLATKRGIDLYISTLIESMLDDKIGERRSLVSLYSLCRELEAENSKKYLSNLHARGSVSSLRQKIYRLKTSNEWNIFVNKVRNPATHWREERFYDDEVYNSAEVNEALNDLLNSKIPKILNFISKDIFRQPGKLPTGEEYLRSVGRGENPGVWLFDEKWQVQ